MSAAERINWYGEPPAYLWSDHPCEDIWDEYDTESSEPANDNGQRLVALAKTFPEQPSGAATNKDITFPRTREAAGRVRSEGEAGPPAGQSPRTGTGRGLTQVEVGLQYFGKRYLNPLLGRWISADPLAVHSPGEADLNVYAYVSGAVLKNVDPLGLQEENANSGGASGNDDNDGTEGAGNTPTVVQDQENDGYLAGLNDAKVNNEADFERAKADKQLKLDLANAKRNHSGDTEGFWKAFNHAFDKHTAALGAIEDWRTAHLMGAPDSEAGKRGYAQGNTRTALIKDKIAGLVGEALISAVGAVALRALIAGRVARVKSGCFVSGTVVWTIEGPRAIEDILPGDLVFSIPEEGEGEGVWREVLEVYEREPSVILDLLLADRGGQEEALGVTPEHPFWGLDGWVSAGDVQPGDRLWSAGRGWLEVVRKQLRYQLEPVYNLNVAEDHTYVVGELGSWVHNTCNGPPRWSETGNKTSVENAYGHFKKHGREFEGVQNARQYVLKAERFVTNPPKGTLSKIREKDGARIFYHKESNTFAVQRQDGAIQTMFKPSKEYLESRGLQNGLAYYNQQFK